MFDTVRHSGSFLIVLHRSVNVLFRYLGAAASCAFVLVATVVQAQSLPQTLQVAIGPELPPLMQVNEAGDPEGFAVDLIRETAERAGMAVSFLVLENADQVAQLDPNQFPVLAWLRDADDVGRQYTPFERRFHRLQGVVFEHRQGRAFSDDHAVSEQVVAVVRGSRAEAIVRKGEWKDVVTTPDVTTAMTLLEQREVDCVAEEKFAGLFAVQQSGYRDIVVNEKHPFQYLEHIALRRAPNRPELESALLAELETLRYSGYTLALQERWFEPLQTGRVASTALIVLGLVLLLTGLVLFAFVVGRRMAARWVQRGRALESSTGRLDEIVNDIEAIVWEARVHAEFTYVSSYAEKMLGYPVDDWLSNPAFWSDVLLHPEDKDETVRECALSAAEGVDHNITYRVVSADGRIVWIRDIVHVVKDSTGTPTKLRGVILDITASVEAQGKIRESEARVQALTRAAPVGLFRLSIAGEVTSANRRAIEITGLSAKDRVAKDWARTVHPEDRKRVLNAWRNAQREKTSAEIRFRFMRDDGEVSWVLGQYEPEFDTNQEVIGFVGTLTDLTEQRTAEEHLHLTQLTVDTYANPIYWIDMSGRFVYVNDAACDSLGYTREELLRLSVPDIDPDFPREIWVEHVDSMRRDHVQKFEGHHRAKDGRVFPVEIVNHYVSLDSREVFCAFAQDISDRVEQERDDRLHADFDRLHATFSDDLIGASLTTLPAVLDEGFCRFATLLDLDCLSVFGSDAEGPRTFRHTWANSENLTGLPSVLDVRRKWPYCVQQYAGRLPVTVESLDQLSFEGATDRETAEEIGFVAFANIPLNVGMNHIGLVSAASLTHTVTWTGELQHRLRVIGDVVASALMRCWSEDSLRLSEERFDRAMIGSADGFWDWPDLGDMHLWWSPRLYELLGFADREMEARFDDALDLIHLDDRELLIRAIQRHLVDGEVFDIEFRIRQKGGCYLWMRARGEAVHHESEGFTSMSGSARDVSDRKAAEEQLRKRDDVLRRTERLARVGGWELDPATGEMYWTDEVKRIHGVPPDYVPTADSAVGFYAPEYIPKFQAVLEELQTSGKPWVLEFELITAQGERIWIESTGEAVWENGKIARLQGSFQDISERKGEEKTRRDLEAQVQQGQKLESLGVLAGGIAHDFNNLLVSILGHAGLALEDVPPGAKPHESIRQIEVAAERAADLAQQMLAYSGKGKFLIQPINLTLLVREMSRLLEVSISKRSMVHLELEEALPAVEGDQTQLQQVVMNLITNASDALGDEPGDITLRTGVITELKDESKTLFADDAPRSGPFVYVEVSDTGCGMSTDTRARIFDPFFTTKFSGRGLGLAAVIGIVRGHHGGLYVDSEVGKGTTFRILFPAAEAVVKQEEAPPPALNGNGCESGTILVVDDEPSVRDFTARALERFGHRVVTAEDGPQALWILAAQDPPVDVLLLDMTMPVMSGEEVVAAIRNTDLDLPILLMSGYSEQETRDRFAKGWVSGFLQKPFQIKVLRQKIETVLAQRQRIT